MVIELLCTTVVPLIWHRRVRHPASTRPSQVAVIVVLIIMCLMSETLKQILHEELGNHWYLDFSIRLDSTRLDDTRLD